MILFFQTPTYFMISRGNMHREYDTFCDNENYTAVGKQKPNMNCRFQIHLASLRGNSGIAINFLFKVLPIDLSLIWMSILVFKCGIL